MTSAAIPIEASDEALIKQTVSTLSLPHGVRFDHIELSESWVGSPMWLIYFALSKSVPLTKKRLNELTELRFRLADNLHKAGIEYWPHFKLLEAE